MTPVVIDEKSRCDGGKSVQANQRGFWKINGGDRAVFTIPVYVLRKTPSPYKVSHPEEDVCHFYLPPFCRITPYKNAP